MNVARDSFLEQTDTLTDAPRLREIPYNYT